METSLIGKALNFGFREYRFESYVSNTLILNNSYTYVISHLKLGLARKSFFFSIFLTQPVLNFLRILKKQNLIRRFQIMKNSTCRVFPTYNKSLLPISIVKHYYKLNRPIYLKVQALKLLSMSLKQSTFILETSKGLVTHNEALRLNVGGVLVCKIN